MKNIGWWGIVRLGLVQAAACVSVFGFEALRFVGAARLAARIEAAPQQAPATAPRPAIAATQAR